jgi:hypothetical protein
VNECVASVAMGSRGTRANVGWSAGCPWLGSGHSLHSISHHSQACKALSCCAVLRCAVLQDEGWKPSITVKQILLGIQVGHSFQAGRQRNDLQHCCIVLMPAVACITRLLSLGHSLLHGLPVLRQAKQDSAYGRGSTVLCCAVLCRSCWTPPMTGVQHSQTRTWCLRSNLQSIARKCASRRSSTHHPTEAGSSSSNSSSRLAQGLWL